VTPVERLAVGLLAGSVDEFSGEAVASLPEVALGAPRAFVIDTLLMRATDDAIRHNDGERAMRFDVFQDLLRDLGVGANVAGLSSSHARISVTSAASYGTMPTATLLALSRSGP